MNTRPHKKTIDWLIDLSKLRHLQDP
jgi:hypothetical protein